MIKNEQFTKELSGVLNRHSIDSACNTPDWVLAEMIDGWLENFKKAIDTRRRFTIPSPQPLTRGAKLSEL